MKNEPRGFEYELEPLRRKSDWELQALRQALARFNAEIVEQQLVLKQFQERLLSATEEHVRRQAKMRIIHIDKQVNAYTYLTQLAEQVKHAKDVLSNLEDKRDAAITELHKLQKFVDGLEEHREKEMKSYVQLTGKADIAEADDAWLRSLYWRTAQ